MALVASAAPLPFDGPLGDRAADAAPTNCGDDSSFDMPLALGVPSDTLHWPVSAVTGSRTPGCHWHPMHGGWRWHYGLDFSNSAGKPVHAAYDGTVTTSEPYCGSHRIILTHPGSSDGSSWSTRYLHITNPVPGGTTVQRGDVIAQVAPEDNCSDGAHLHFELRYNGIAKDFTTHFSPGTATTAGQAMPIRLRAQEPPLCHGQHANIVGSSQGEWILGTSHNDVIHGMGGNDLIAGDAKNDTICGGGGNDVLFGNDGDDWITGGSGTDTCEGNAGDDTLFCETITG